MNGMINYFNVSTLVPSCHITVIDCFKIAWWLRYCSNFQAPIFVPSTLVQALILHETDKRNLHNKKPPEIDKQDINFLVCEGGIQEQQNGLSTYIPGKNITEKPIHRGTIQMALSKV